MSQANTPIAGMALKLHNHRNNMYYLSVYVANEVRIFIKAKCVC